MGGVSSLTTIHQTAINKVRDAPRLRWQHVFRAHALGSFRTLLQKVSRDPAMLRWLDSSTNRRLGQARGRGPSVLPFIALTGGHAYNPTQPPTLDGLAVGWSDPRSCALPASRGRAGSCLPPGRP